MELSDSLQTSEHTGQPVSSPVSIKRSTRNWLFFPRGHSASEQARGQLCAGVSLTALTLLSPVGPQTDWKQGLPQQ
jgi:hypothetical protein